MQNESVKKEVAKFIGGHLPVSSAGSDVFKIGSYSVHFRYRTSPKAKSGNVFSYNVNPNTLRCDYEVWICGDAMNYYLFPQALMSELYHDPGAYVDYHHPNIRVMEIDLGNHSLLYARGGKRIDAAANFRKTLETLN